jgi:hypothetical protein
MLKFERQPVKRTNIAFLIRGAIILYNDKLYVFDRIPRGSTNIYVRNIDTLKFMKIPITNSDRTFFDVVGYCDINELNPPNDLTKLQKGDLFIINHETKGSYIFRYERMTDNYIIAINPINNKEIRIRLSINVTYTKLENIPF